MLFNSWEFLLFFVAVVAVYGVLATRAQNVWLLLASYFFYGWWDWRFLGLVWLSTAVDYLVARRVHAAGSPRRRKRWLGLSIGVNLGVLGFFKYFDFFVGSTVDALNAVGLHAEPIALQIVLPVGISFYTFQTLAYTIDVYRRKLEPERDPVVFALYVCYFPQLVAGPIERADRLLPQLRTKRRVGADQLSSGAFLIFSGLVRKVGVADVVAPRVDEIFAHADIASSATLALGVVLFAIQIYGDFSGYSAIARGTSKLLGIELMENFRQPYFATNITVFWRRWHMSLSSWLRDYLYIPLGGNRGSRYATYRNLMLTMLLGGLWHGASWTFVVWGAIHGVALAVHKLATGNRKILDNPDLSSPRAALLAVPAWIGTMVVVLAAWVFFRAPTFDVAWNVFTGIAALRGKLHMADAELVVLSLLWLFVFDIPAYRRREPIGFLRTPWPVRGFVYAVSVLAMVLLERKVEATFIYFQF